MELDVYANIFEPVAPNEPYLVVASAFATEDQPFIDKNTNRAVARSIDEARAKRRHLSEQLRKKLEAAGHRVRAVHLK